MGVYLKVGPRRVLIFVLRELEVKLDREMGGRNVEICVQSTKY
jgi:hypothetical protein